MKVITRHLVRICSVPQLFQMALKGELIIPNRSISFTVIEISFIILISDSKKEKLGDALKFKDPSYGNIFSGSIPIICQFNLFWWHFYTKRRSSKKKVGHFRWFNFIYMENMIFFVNPHPTAVWIQKLWMNMYTYDLLSKLHW